MFKLNLKIAWRNLLKHKWYAVINIFGLALGLAGFIFMMLFINREKSYDTWDPELKNVYQVQEYSDFFSTDKKAHWISAVDFRLSSIFSEHIPEVKAITMLNLHYRDHGVTIPGKPAFLQSGIRRSDSLFFKVMPYTFIYGNRAIALEKPNSIVLKESLAIKYFGHINPVGKKINISGGSWSEGEPFTVTGVIREPATPSSINFEAIVFEGSHYFNVNSYGTESEIYVRTGNISNPEQFNKKIQQAYMPVKDGYLKKDEQSWEKKVQEGITPVLKLTPLADIHQHPLEKQSWKETMKPVILLCTLLLCVAIINFINLATAQAAGRAKEIGVKKIVGAYRKSLIFQFLTETFIQTIFAMLTGLLLIELLLPLINQSFSTELTLFKNDQFFTFIFQLIVVTALVGLLVGLYPAFVLSSYKPQQVLKGNFATGQKGTVLRKVLAGAQFVISVSFIIGILTVNYQLKFLKERDNGFTPTGLITMKYGGGADDTPDIKELRKIDGIKYVSFSSGIIGDYKSNAYSYQYNGEQKELYGWGLGIDGMQALDARLLAGRLFSRSVVQDTVNNAILNESAAKMFNENMVGKTIVSKNNIPIHIIGIIKDIQVEGYENMAKPTIYAVYTGKWGGVSFTVKPTTLVRYELSKRKEVTKKMEEFFAARNEFYPLSYTFTEDNLTAVLIDHERFEKMVALFSVLSLALSLFGLFALSAFITRQRIKEIAVRKVLGAENTDILILLNKGYVRILLIANLIAFPLAYIFINKWLSSFAYRIEISPLPFILALVGSLTITIITISMQVRKALKANPVDALKYE